uniref:Polyubiquitin-like n=2 Tax=Nicotiana sylvestris TaxID=4096 RepID=A0A1U7WM40_NICSY
ITIYLRVSKTVALKVKKSDSIGNVKALLCDKEGVPEHLQHLFSEDNRLMDEQKLVDYGIRKNSTVYAYVEDSVPVMLYVKRTYAKVIESRVGQSMDDMDLFLGKQKLEDLKELYQYDIKEDSLLQGVPRVIQIVIRKSNGQEITLDVHQHELIKNVKGMIQNKLGIPVHLQGLLFAGKSLADSWDLASYDIENDSTLHLNDRN